jgi:adenosylmethionine-8-amino-7-oxononanoate aminotransferase
MTSVFRRSDDVEEAVSASGCWVIDSKGRRYLDAAGGAIVCSIGHGRSAVIDAIAAQLGAVDYVHASAFTTPVLEEYAARLAGRVPLRGARVYPVSGGSEAMETALKVARAYHLARGEEHRTTMIGRWGSYHGNSLGALDVSGRTSLRRPYLPWLGRAAHVPVIYEYRCPAPVHPDGCGAWHAATLEEEIVRRGDVACFVAESVGGATLGAVVPPDDYWPAVADVCRRHGVLLIVDEVMAGFGRTGAWFGIDHWGVSPDMIVAGKGASSGYWPLGLCIVNDSVHEIAGPGFVHGFTYSHHPAGAAAGLAVLRILEEENLVEASVIKGDMLQKALIDALSEHPHVGDIRGRGLLVAVELVSERATKRPFARSEAVTERVLVAARSQGLLVYPASKGVDGVNGDAVLIGPPLTISPEEIALTVERLVAAIWAAIPRT